jgi:glucosamine--fructose-6-phosphate aminotransferase (isomerizing)
MYLTEREIFSQYDALRKTYDYITARAQEIKAVYQKHQPRSLTFIGSGSGYCLCQSAGASTKDALGPGGLAISWPTRWKRTSIP